MLKVAVVSRAEAFANVTVPGPLTRLHVVVTGPGKPSSVTMPWRFAEPVTRMVWLVAGIDRRARRDSGSLCVSVAIKTV